MRRDSVGKMKTLDEVIEAQERCETYPNCHFCYLHSGPMCEWIRDALHYLKEYRSDKAMWEADRKGHLDWIEQYKEAREKHQQAVIELKKNPPLTWDELYSRNGMPVWIEDSFDNGEWYIIECFTASNRFVAHDRWGDTTLFNKKEMDDVWKAYRKERDER